MVAGWCGRLCKYVTAMIHRDNHFHNAISRVLGRGNIDCRSKTDLPVGLLYSGTLAISLHLKLTTEGSGMFEKQKA